MNTWPEGKQRPLHQSEHEAWNASNYPGTRQLCLKCEQPTGRCEEDSLYLDDNGLLEGPLCEWCYHSAIDLLDKIDGE